MKILNDFFSPQLPDNIGDVHLEWNFKEYEHEAVNRTWYIVGAIVLAGLLAYSVFTANFLFAIILLLSVFVIILLPFPPIVIFFVINRNMFLFSSVLASISPFIIILPVKSNLPSISISFLTTKFEAGRHLRRVKLLS